MGRWTVMVIPQGRGSSSTYTLKSSHIWFGWGMGALVVLLSFSSTFLFQRYRTAQAVAETLKIERAQEVLAPTQAVAGLSEEEAENIREEVTRQVRTEYEKAFATIAGTLNSVYDVEAQVREIHGLPPRSNAQFTTPLTPTGKGGVGGGPSFYDRDSERLPLQAMRPSSLIYGLVHPSTDLIFQEISLRAESLQHLLKGMEAKRDRIARTPSIWPTSERNRYVSSAFGYRKDPLTNRVRHHDGTDIPVPRGTPVLATAKGTVIFSAQDAGFGHMIKIDHGFGVHTWYAHLSRRDVKVGDTVERGDPIGTVGSTGYSTGPHVHYEVHVNGKPVDSGLYLGG